MALTRGQIVTEICDIVGKKTSASSVSGASLQTRVGNYFNWAQRRIARAYSFKELNETYTTSHTVADVKTYPLTSGTNNLGLARVKDILTIRLIDSENSKALVRWSYRKFDRWYPRPENYTSARPRIYLWFGTYIELFKVPDAVYDLYIRVAHWPTELSTDGQTSDFQEKDELLVTAGVMETYLALEEYVDAKVWGNKFAGERYLQTGAIGGMLRDVILADDADVDWEPEAEPGRSIPEYMSGTPYSDPYGSQGDPLYGYGD